MKRLLIVLFAMSLLLTSCATKIEVPVAQPLNIVTPETYSAEEVINFYPNDKVAIETKTIYKDTEEVITDYKLWDRSNIFKTETGLFVPVEEANTKYFDKLNIEVDNKDFTKSAYLSYNNIDLFIEENKLTVYKDNEPSYMEYDTPFMNDQSLYCSINFLLDAFEITYREEENTIIIERIIDRSTQTKKGYMDSLNNEEGLD